MTDQRMSPVESLRELPVQLPHAPSQIAVHRLQQQMVVIGHLAERMYHPVEPQAGSTQNFHPDAPIVVVKKDVFAAVTARGHMVEGAGEL